MEKPILKTPPQPEIVYMDLDAVLFAAASAGEQVVYVAKTPEGEQVARFDSASKHKNWLKNCESFEMDMEFGFTGDMATLERHTEYEIGDFKDCTKAFKSMVKTWFERSGCKEYVGYISKASGEKNFRYAVATVQAYKGGRKESHKPHYLEELRKWVKGQPHMKTARGSVEVDDVVCALAQRKKYKGCVMGVDKDARGASDTHVFIPEEMEFPEFSSKKIVGKLYKNNKGKVQGCGTLFWLWQSLGGDSADKIPGCKGTGAEGAFKLLQEFDGVDVKYLKDAVAAVAEVFNKQYGTDYSHKYNHHETGEEIFASGKELFIEMSTLVYMKKSQTDECFWIPIIEELYEKPDIIEHFKSNQYKWLSNFHKCDVFYNDVRYPSAEAAYMAEKSDDPAWKEICRTCDNPASVKAQSRAVKLVYDWEKIKDAVMFEVVLSKFLANPELAKLLQATGDAHIQEGNWWNDKYWGVCLKTGEGENRLGEILMAVRKIVNG